MTEITDAEMDEWLPQATDLANGMARVLGVATWVEWGERVLRLIDEVRRLRKRVALCPHCGCNLAGQALENPPLHEA